MATIQSQLRLNDGMSAVLRSVTSALDTCLRSFEEMRAASGQAMDVASIQTARLELLGANETIEKMEKGAKAAAEAQHGYNRAVQAGSFAADGLLSKVKNIVTTIAAASGIKKLIGTSDQLAGSSARLSLIVDDQNSVDLLQRKIFASAQASRGAYLEVMDTVSKLGLTAGNSFTGNDEMIRFAQLMNQNFVIAGASAAEQSSAMYQLTQAMAAGRLQGDEYRSIIENAPLLANSIEDYMRNVRGATGTMKEWAAEGLLTSGVIKAALFSSADEIEARFAQMPRTWAQNWTAMKNNAIIALQPLFNYIGQLANDPRVLTAITEITGAISGIAQIAIPVIDMIVAGLAWTGENLEWIMPLLLGIAAAYVLVHGATVAYNTVMAISNGLSAVKAAWLAMNTIAAGAETTATFAATAAQYGFNAALLACPLTWIVLAIIAVIVIIYAVIAAINQAKGTTLSATGIILGVLTAAASIVWNIFLTLLSLIIQSVLLPLTVAWDAFANFFGNIFNDPIATIIQTFENLAKTVLGILKTIANGIDAIFGSNLAGAVQGWMGWVSGKADFLSRKYGNGTYKEQSNLSGKLQGLLSKAQKSYSWSTTDAFNTGYGWGADIGSSVGDFLGNDLDAGLGGLGGLGNPSGIGGADMSGYQPAMDGIKGNTGSAAASLKNMSEDVAYMRDIAEREAINRFTTAELHVDMTGMTNRFENDMDVDGVINRFVTGVTEALEVGEEGVHQ